MSSDTSNAPKSHIDVHELLLRLRRGRQQLIEALSRDIGTRECVFDPPRFVNLLVAHIEDLTECAPHERGMKMYMLTVLAYGALDWQFDGKSADIESDVQIERLHQIHRFGGAAHDDRLSWEDWRQRLLYQVGRLRGLMDDAKLYSGRLVKVAALTQAALEALTRGAMREQR